MTNQGIETASGSVVFYDANGNPVAKSTFEDLASGDIVIASYDVADSSAGGDVSAKVMLDQTERYTYNNEATMHILAPYFPTAIRIIKSTAKGVAATIYCEVGGITVRRRPPGQDNGRSSVIAAYSILSGLSREAAFQPMLCQFRSVAARFAGAIANNGTDPARFSFAVSIRL